jgi:hypothetical protein
MSLQMNEAVQLLDSMNQLADTSCGDGQLQVTAALVAALSHCWFLLLPM